MTLRGRAYQSEDDFWRVRAFLREVFLRNGRREPSWEVLRFDYWRFHVLPNCLDLSIAENLLLWETSTGALAGAVMADGPAEGPREAFLQVDPDLRSAALEAEMIAAAEEHFAVPDIEGRRPLTLWAGADDPLRQGLLAERGYARSGDGEYQRRRSLDLPIPDCRPAPGFTVRALGGVEEHPARSWASWKGFHPDEPETDYQGHEWYLGVQRCPLYRRDLDLVAVTDAGEIASFCTAWFDDTTRTGVFEPVATHPDHLRRGLASAVMVEGMRRLKWYGADLALVSSYSEAAGRTYASLGFVEYDLMEPWSKR